MHIFKNAVAAFLRPAVIVLVTLPGAVSADAASEAALMDQLRSAEPAEAGRIERQIRMDWSNSGSSAMDLLLKRGKDALEAGDIETAIGHLSALTDHAPDFAEGWHTRAMAFFREEEYGLALHDLERTLALNPDHFGAIFGLAVVFESLDRIPEAYRLYTRVLDVHPNHKDAQEGADRLRIRVDGTEI